MTTCTRTDDDGTYYLWRWSVSFVKRGLEVAFPPHEDVVEDDMSRQDFEAWKAAEFVRGLGDLEVPRAWREHHYPPDAAGGKVVALPDGDLKYLRVTSEVLRRYRQPDLHWKTRQVDALDAIADALDEGGGSWRVKLPATMCLAGALDPTKSQFGDEFFNFPPFLGSRPAPGHTFLSGWIEVVFSPPKNGIAPFQVLYFGVGSRDKIEWGGGQVYTFARNRAFPSLPLPGFPSVNAGELDLATGEAKVLGVTATFQNSTIGDVDKVNRIPFAFPFIYPPLPIPPPPGVQPPPASASLAFDIAADGRIVGLRFEGKSLAFVTLFPMLPPGQSPFPPFSWGEGGTFHFANPTLCLPGTPPANCPRVGNNPDGILLPIQAFFHPHFELTADGVAEVPPTFPPPASTPEPVADAVLLAAGGKLYLAGGQEPSGPTARVWVYDSASRTWSAGPSLPEPITCAGGAVVDGRLYVLGGWKTNGRASDRVSVLEPGAGGWIAGPSLPSPVAEAAVAATGGRIYVVSGATLKGKKRKVVPEVSILDVAAGGWSSGQASPLPVAGAGAAVLGGKVWVLNGELAEGRATARISIYDPGANQWSLGPNLRQGVPEVTLPRLTRHAAVELDGRLYMVGGRRTLDGPTADEQFVQDPAKGDLWFTNISAGLPVAGAAAAALGGVVFVAGGRVQNGAATAPGQLTDVVQAFHPALGWRISGARPVLQSALVLNEAGLGVGPTVGTGPERRPAAALCPGGRGLVLGYWIGQGPTVSLGGKAVEVLGVTPDPATTLDKLHFLVPPDAKPDPCAPLVVKRSDGAQAEVPVAVGAVSPGLYVYGYVDVPTFVPEPSFLDHGPALACNSDGSLNFADQPTVPGGEIVLYATGLGAAAGLAAYCGNARNPATVGTVADAPGLPGVSTVSLTLPADLELSSNVPVVLELDGVESNTAVVAVRAEAVRKDPPLPCQVGLAFVFGPPPT